MRGARPVQRRKAWENELTSVYPSNQAIRETDRFPSAKVLVGQIKPQLLQNSGERCAFVSKPPSHCSSSDT